MINNQEFVKRLALKLEVDQKTTSKVVKVFQELIFELLEDNEKVKVGDFLVFSKKEVEAKEKRLPNGEYTKVEAGIRYSAQLTDRYKKAQV